MRLETQRLLLRDAVESDVKALALYQSNPRYLEHYAEPPDAEAIVQQASAWASACPRVNFQLIVTLKDSQEVIGCAGLRQEGHAQGIAEIGIELGPDHWGSGYAREAIVGLLKFGKASLNLEQLVSVTSPTNIRAQYLLEHFGFSRTGDEGMQLVYEASIDAA